MADIVERILTLVMFAIFVYGAYRAFDFVIRRD